MLTFLLSEFKTWFTAADDSGQGMFLCSACVAFISVESNFLVSFTYNDNNNDRLTAFDPGQPG